MNDWPASCWLLVFVCHDYNALLRLLLLNSRLLFGGWPLVMYWAWWIFLFINLFVCAFLWRDNYEWEHQAINHTLGHLSASCANNTNAPLTIATTTTACRSSPIMDTGLRWRRPQISVVLFWNFHMAPMAVLFDIATSLKYWQFHF